MVILIHGVSKDIKFTSSKSTWGEQLVEDILKFTHIFVYVFMCLCVSRLLAKRKTLQTWNLAPILPLTLPKNGFFCFFNQIPVTAASLKKLPCHVDFLHISSIALFSFQLFPKLGIIYPNVGKYCFSIRDSLIYFSVRARYERVLK